MGAFNAARRLFEITADPVNTANRDAVRALADRGRQLDAESQARGAALLAADEARRTGRS